MKILLIFPPFALPTYIPLAPAQLKSYLEEKNNKNNTKERVDVKFLDLNLSFHNVLFSNLEAKKESHALTPLEKNAVNASKLFKGTPDILFKNNQEYDSLSKDFLFYLNDLYQEYDKSIEEALYLDNVPNTLIQKWIKITIEKIKSEKPDIIGFSTMLSEQWNFACFLSHEIKRSLPNAKIVFGGSTFATEPKEKFNPDFMDFLIYGEAELAFNELINSNINNIINNNNSPENVPNLIYLRNEEIIVNKRVELDSLDNVPAPDFSDYSLEEYLNPYPVLPIYMSRSCPWKKCSFCVHYKTFSKYREKKVMQLINEIGQYIKQGHRYFNFVDEMLSPDFLEKFCSSIISNNIKIFWYCTCKPMKGFSSEIFKKMYKAGCRLTFWGVESGCQEILDKMNKSTSVREISQILKNANNAGIRNHLLWILGFPGESQKELEESKGFLEKNRTNVHSVELNPFFLYKGTEIFNNPEKFGITSIIDKDLLKRNYLYDIKKGFTFDQIVLLCNVNQRFFDSFNSFSKSFNILRDHALMFYSQ